MPHYSEKENETTPEIDKEANRFASELLMPDKLIRKEIALSGKEIDEILIGELSSTFEVSPYRTHLQTTEFRV